MQQQRGAPLLMHARVSFARDCLLPVSENKRPPFIDKSYMNQKESDFTCTSGFYLKFSIVSGMAFLPIYQTSFLNRITVMEFQRHINFQDGSHGSGGSHRRRSKSIC